jgi:penicillin-binding protein 1B
LCVVWIGLDDYQDLKVEGAKAALPVWTEFMRRAHQHRAYRDVSEFAIPEGVVSSQIDPQSGQLATAACPVTKTEYFLVGTQPVQLCPLHQGGSTQIAAWGDSAAPTPSGSYPVIPAQPASTVRPPFPEAAVKVDPAKQEQANQDQGQPPDPLGARPQKKSGLLGKLKGIFK